LLPSRQGERCIAPAVFCDNDQATRLLDRHHTPMRRIVSHRKLSFFFIFNDINDFINRNF